MEQPTAQRQSQGRQALQGRQVGQKGKNKATHWGQHGPGHNPGADTTHDLSPIDLSTHLTGSNGAARFQQLSRSLFRSANIVHLSFFDGIGAASHAPQQLGVSPVLTLSWETDPEYIHVLNEHFGPKHMGHIQSFDIHSLVDIIRSETDSSKAVTILLTAGLPCPDFSGIRASPLGSGGQTGHLFFDLIQIISQINAVFHPSQFTSSSRS